MKKIFIITLICFSFQGFAQKVKLVQGDVKALKGQKSIKLEFTYDKMTIGKEGLTEQDYINKKKAEYDKKEPGRGDKWETAWVDDRKTRFEPNFTELFEKHSGMKTSNDGKYTLVFHTTRTEPGWNVGVMRAPARIDAEAFLVETSNPSNVIAKFTVTNAPGRDAMGYDFETGVRLQEAYAKSGKELGKIVAD